MTKLILLTWALLASIASAAPTITVSIADQKLRLLDDGRVTQTFPVSTATRGVGDRPGSWKTPLGEFVVAEKIGVGLPLGAVFSKRRWTGRIAKPDNGRNQIVTRILRLAGGNAYERGIYIHGTTKERQLGSPASIGCIHLSSGDVVRLFDLVPVGTRVVIACR